MANFNPRSREGSDRFPAGSSDTQPISIHAPAKGATHGGDGSGLCDTISIHAPAKGATKRKWC